MAKHKINLDRIPTRELASDLDRRQVGVGVHERIDFLSSFVQKSALICLAGILPLGAARESLPVGRREDEGTALKQSTDGASGGDMDLSTLQDLVSGVGVILTSDFSLPRPSGTGPGKSGGGIAF